MTVAEPLLPPKHETFVCDPVVVSAGGCVIVAVAVAVAPIESVTVTVYEPAQRPVVVDPVPPLGAHE
jgi:hypothetical protein